MPVLKGFTNCWMVLSTLMKIGILRHFLSVIEAMLRTNAYQKQGQGEPKSYLSFKLQPEKIPTSPHPRPMF